MASTIKIDGWDLYPYLRVAPGEGFEPSDILTDPQFSNPALGEGQPLINFTTKNREVVIPVHLKPEWSHASYASTRDGLNNLIIDMNRVLRDAKRLEWKDEGVATSTFYDVQYARFEPEYNYRRAGVRLLSGNVHLWTSPYGDTNAERLVASGIGTGPVYALPIASLAGDVSSNLNINIKVGATTPISNYSRDGRIVGYSIVPSGYVVSHPAASLLAGFSTPTTIVATDSIGSAAIWQTVPNLPIVPSSPVKLAQLQLSNASVYQGRQRVFAVIRSTYPQSVPVAAMYNGVPLYPNREAVASYGGAWTGWGTVDLGVADIDRTNATALISVVAYPISLASRAMVDASPFGSQSLQIANLVTVPEDHTSIVFDATRKVSGRIECEPSSNPLLIDSLGNPLWNGTYVATFSPAAGSVGAFRKGGGGTYFTSGLVIGHDPVADIQVRAVGFNFNETNPSTAIEIGKISQAFGVWEKTGVRVQRNASMVLINLLTDAGGLLASAGVVATSTITVRGVLEYQHIAGSSLIANVRFGSLAVATVSSLTSQSQGKGYGFVKFTGSIADGSFVYVRNEVTVAEVPSRPMNLGDQYHWTATTVDKSASVGKTFMDTYARGNTIKPNPGRYEQFVALNLPLDGGSITDFLTVDVRALERFTFSQ